jgi:predicted dehydrogenase
MTTTPRTGPVAVGLIGAGMISDTYLENLTSFPDVTVLIVGDLDPVRARSQADAHGVPEAGTADDVLAHPGVELVINLTIPAVHAQVSAAAVAAGKNVWSEKPISIDRAQPARGRGRCRPARRHRTRHRARPWRAGCAPGDRTG